MKFFSLENPIWKFIGNLADFFLLSCLWYLCCLPVVTGGAATTALYYVTLKMARGQEGQLIPAFFHSFKQNLKQATALWVGYLAVGILLVLDLVICQHLTLHLRLEPCDIERLFQIQRLAPCIASTFLFRIGGEEIRCTLRRIEGYDPSAASTRCTFTRLPNG